MQHHSTKWLYTITVICIVKITCWTQQVWRPFCVCPVSHIHVVFIHVRPYPLLEQGPFWVCGLEIKHYYSYYHFPFDNVNRKKSREERKEQAADEGLENSRVRERDVAKIRIGVVALWYDVLCSGTSKRWEEQSVAHITATVERNEREITTWIWFVIKQS